MKQILWSLLIVVVLLFVMNIVCATVKAGPLDSIRNYQVDMRWRLNVDTTTSAYLSDAMATTFIREAVMTILPPIRGKKTTWGVVSTYRQGTYSLDTAVLGISAVVWSKNDSLKSLTYVPKGKWYEMSHKTTSGQSTPYPRRPSYYDYDDDNIYVYPVPTVVGDTLRITGWQHLANIGSATDLSSIPQSYRPVILSYALYLFARAKSHPERETFYRDLQFTISLINMALNTRGEGYAIPIPPK